MYYCSASIQTTTGRLAKFRNKKLSIKWTTEHFPAHNMSEKVQYEYYGMDSVFLENAIQQNKNKMFQDDTILFQRTV